MAGRPANAVTAEAPVYWPFALLAYGTTLAVATPLGIWTLARLYLLGGPVSAPWLWLHAHLQLFGFLVALIVGIAPHLLARFANRPLDADWPARPLLGLVAAGLALRVLGAALVSPAATLGGAVLELAALARFALRLRRALDTPALRPTRGHLGPATGWLLAALAVEGAVRAAALAGPIPGPDPRGLRAAHALALLGGVTGWVTGVLVRAGPMFFAGWRVPPRLARVAPWALGLGALGAAAGEALGLPAGPALARLGETLALGTVAAVAAAGGAWRRPRGTLLPMVAQRGPETWLLRLALASATAAAGGALGAGALAVRGMSAGLLPDAVRHLHAVGCLAAVAVAMTFRLVPVIERAPLRWPGLRRPAGLALALAVILRTAEIGGDLGWPGVLPWLPLSGALAWLALASAAVNVASARRGVSAGAPGPTPSSVPRP